ncbi:helix-turn-helix domain-containing protein [Collinsella intestinalis]|uniref:helix-turn-helix domain-containing protein n=1 Tax=Collinsella intestinalis TaxID=147207 RepID=UPI0022E0E221|nr:helix-turn-helix domain-containing protein [Collinsella intestinalis]
MGTDRRCRYGEALLLEAARLHDAGLGRRAIGARLGVPHATVRKWLDKYRAGGTELLLKMGGKQARYDYETKVAAASAVVDGGMGKPEAMGRFGLASMKPLESWIRLYREGGAEALRPKPKGRPRGSGRKAAPPTREQELEREVRRLEAQVAYLKKSIALKAELGLPLGTGRRP